MAKRTESDTQKNITDELTSVKKKEKRDYFLLAMPWKSASLKMKIANKIVAILAKQPLLRERDIIEKLIAEGDEISQYVIQNQSVSIIRYVIWYLAKKKIIYKAKILGDDKHVYYFLPDQLDLVKSNILLYPSDFSPSVLKYYSTGNKENTNTSTRKSTGGSEEEEGVEEGGEEDEEVDEWFEECLKSGGDC
jgi:hypothetical protein